MTLMKKNGVIPLVVAFTPNYFVPAATCLLSVLKYSDKSDRFHVIVLLSEDLPDNMMGKLELLDDDRMSFSFLNLEGQLADIYVNEKYTVAASYRLLLPELLVEYDKVLYIDCDMIIRNNLAELYRNTDLKSNYLAGVFEATLDFQEAHLKEIGCQPGEYINSGFLIMNLALMRKDKMTGKFLEASKADYLEFPDQDVLNQLCKGKILGLSPQYNSIRTFFLPQYKNNFLKYYAQKDWEDVQNHGNIHYTGAKPWNAYTVKFIDWWTMYGMLPQTIKKEWLENKKLRLLSSILRTSVGRIAMNLMQRLVRGLKYRNN